MKQFKFDSKKHIYTLDGKPLNGVTTVLGVVDKPWLTPWALNISLAYITKNLKKLDDLDRVLSEAKKEPFKRRDLAGDIGTKFHKWVEEYIKNGASTISKDIKPMVDNFLLWVTTNDVKFLQSEKRMYSEKYWIAGTADFTCMIKGKKYVGDLKTGKGIYDRIPFFQTAGYRLMLEEMGEKNYHGSVIIRCGKIGDFEDKYSFDYETDLKGFLSCLNLYRALRTF